MRRDFEVLPKISGRGRYLGANIGVRGDSVYENTWWGEGEVKIYLDGDGEYPSLTGTGAEDYIGTGWGQGVFIHRLSGCLVADPDSALTLVRLLEKSDATDLSDPGLPSGWVNFYRQDDVCAAAYFYLDAPSSTAPDLAPVRFRTHGTK